MARPGYVSLDIEASSSSSKPASLLLFATVAGIAVGSLAGVASFSASSTISDLWHTSNAAGTSQTLVKTVLPITGQTSALRYGAMAVSASLPRDQGSSRLPSASYPYSRSQSNGSAGLAAIGGFMLTIGALVGLRSASTGQRPSTLLRHHGETADGQPIIPALLLDCDGTIVDTERDGHRVAFNKAFQQKGLDGVEWGVELYGELLTTGGGKERMTRYFKDYAPSLWPDASQDPSPSHPLIVELHKLKTRLFMDIIEQGSLPLRPGIKSIVEEALADGWKVAVCSTSNEKAVQAVVDKLLDGKIKNIFAGDMVAKKKPDPAIYNMAAKELNLNPAHCVVIEDSRIGLLAARAAGMACVVTKSTYTAEEDFTGAQLVVDDLSGTGLTSVEALIE